MLCEFSEVTGFHLGSKNMNKVLEEGENNDNTSEGLTLVRVQKVGSEARGVVDLTQSEQPACPDYKLPVRNSRKHRLAKTKITFIRLSCCTTTTEERLYLISKRVPSLEKDNILRRVFHHCFLMSYTYRTLFSCT